MVSWTAFGRISLRQGKIENITRIVETAEDKEKRAAAIWEGDCSFEAQNDGEADWLKMIQDYYGLTKGLVDVLGNSVDKDFEYQADMCEIIRAFAANNKFPLQFEMTNIPSDITEHIKCAGKAGILYKIRLKLNLCFNCFFLQLTKRMVNFVERIEHQFKLNPLMEISP